MICIVISTTFWFFNALNKSDYVTRINYPVDIQFDEEAYIATAPLPTKIPIEVSGGGWDLMTRYFGFKMNPIELQIQQPDENGYVMSSSLRGEIMPELEPITINYFLQDSISFKVERKITSTVTLQYDTVNLSLDNNYQRSSSIRISPQTIELTGPISKIEAIGDTVWLQNVISGVSNDFQDEITLPEMPELVTASKNSVSLSFQVVRLLSIDDSILIEKVNFPSNWTLAPERVELKYKIRETAFDATDSTAIKLIADFKAMRRDSTILLKMQVLNRQIQDVQLNLEAVKGIKQ